MSGLLTAKSASRFALRRARNANGFANQSSHTPRGRPPAHPRAGPGTKQYSRAAKTRNEDPVERPALSPRNGQPRVGPYEAVFGHGSGPSVKLLGRDGVN